jgi:signal peptidase II
LGGLGRLVEDQRKLFWTFACATCALDQLTKLLLWTHPGDGHPPVVLIPHLLRIISHEGNVRGALGLGPQGRLFYIAAAAVGLAVVAFFVLTTAPHNRLVHGALGLLAGGAAGNLLDRTMLGFVRDFIDLHWGDAYHWHTFNLADAAICIGFGLVLYDTFFRSRGEPGPAKAERTSAARQ